MGTAEAWKYVSVSWDSFQAMIPVVFAGCTDSSDYAAVPMRRNSFAGPHVRVCAEPEWQDFRERCK